MAEKLGKLVEELSNLSVLELSELSEALKDKWGVTAASFAVAAPQAMASTAAAPAVSAVEEKSEFTIHLEAVGSNKIGVIKVVREITGLGLKEAKDLVDSAPKPVKEGVSKDEAETLKKKLEEAGATIKLL